ncbi:hypothetical protein [Paraburkholderia sp. SIMBA_054]|uniref:hypothetical protein n=1 Tax=Paraburkholderia sp. SIMBA_054 TaxID=3085795 RepID=UPI00397DB1CA
MGQRIGALFAFAIVCISWDLILEYCIGATIIAIAWSGYLVSLVRSFGTTIPDQFARTPFAFDPGTAWRHTGAILPTIFHRPAHQILLVTGIRESARVNSIIAVVKALLPLAVGAAKAGNRVINLYKAMQVIHGRDR